MCLQSDHGDSSTVCDTLIFSFPVSLKSLREFTDIWESLCSHIFVSYRCLYRRTIVRCSFPSNSSIVTIVPSYKTQEVHEQPRYPQNGGTCHCVLSINITFISEASTVLAWNGFFLIIYASVCSVNFHLSDIS